MEELQAAGHIIANRVVDTTKGNYKGKLNTIKIYLSQVDSQRDEVIN